MKHLGRRIFTAWLIVFLGVQTGTLRAEEPITDSLRRKVDELSLGAGSFDFARRGGHLSFSGEYRFGYEWNHIRPHLGLKFVGNGPRYYYGGIRVDLDLGERFVATPSFSAGVYERNGGLDLGGPLEFRSSLELSYRITERSRIGVSYDHMSNAGVYDDNPGSESLYVVYVVELGALVGGKREE